MYYVGVDIGGTFPDCVRAATTSASAMGPSVVVCG